MDLEEIKQIDAHTEQMKWKGINYKDQLIVGKDEHNSSSLSLLQDKHCYSFYYLGIIGSQHEESKRGKFQAQALCIVEYADNTRRQVPQREAKVPAF